MRITMHSRGLWDALHRHKAVAVVKGGRVKENFIKDVTEGPVREHRQLCKSTMATGMRKGRYHYTHSIALCHSFATKD